MKKPALLIGFCIVLSAFFGCKDTKKREGWGSGWEGWGGGGGLCRLDHLWCLRRRNSNAYVATYHGSG